MRIVWTAPAAQDLAAARAYIARDNPPAADQQVESLSGHIPRSSLRSSDLLPFYHQYPAACCGDFLLCLCGRRQLASVP
jgi:hypothetical protein